MQRHPDGLAAHFPTGPQGLWLRAQLFWLLPNLSRLVLIFCEPALYNLGDAARLATRSPRPAKIGFAGRDSPESVISAPQRAALRDPTGAETMSKTPVEVLSPEEVELLIAHPTSDDVVGLRDTAILAMLYFAAATAGEVSGLDLSDIRRRARSLRFRAGEGRERRAPLEKRLARVLAQYVKESRPLLLAQGGVTDARKVPAVFITNRGHRIHVRDIRQLLGSHSKAASIETPVNTNTLRLSRAWHLREQGVSPEAIQRLLGMSSRSGRRVV